MFYARLHVKRPVATFSFVTLYTFKVAMFAIMLCCINCHNNNYYSCTVIISIIQYLPFITYKLITVIKMVYIALTGHGTPRRVQLRSIDISTQAVQDYISTLTIHNISDNYTSNDLAYRPNYSGGNTAIVFVNLETAFPCYRYNQINPICQLITFEEDSFQFGKAFIQASDVGNDIFSNNHSITTYGFGVTGCSTFDRACVSDFEALVVCLLPPALNHCGL